MEKIKGSDRLTIALIAFVGRRRWDDVQNVPLNARAWATLYSDLV